jgi:hypothetical protein
MSVPELPTSLRSWMSAVTEIVRAVNAAVPLEEVLSRVAVHACDPFGFEFCAVPRWTRRSPGPTAPTGAGPDHPIGGDGGFLEWALVPVGAGPQPAGKLADLHPAQLRRRHGPALPAPGREQDVSGRRFRCGGGQGGHGCCP